MKRSDAFNNVQQNKRQKLDSGPSTKIGNEWDDDLNGDLLEEACIIAELTQAANDKQFKQPAAVCGQDVESYTSAENKRLREALKTKEGEVGILRSQLKTQQAVRDNDMVNNRRTVDLIEERNKVNLEALKKSVESLQNELDFKNLEVKGLIEKCKQLEVRGSKVQFVQPANDDRKSLFCLSQAISSNKSKCPVRVEDTNFTPETEKKEINEGENLGQMIPPSFSVIHEEPLMIQMYPCSTTYKDILDIAKSDKYKWTGLPKHSPQLHLIRPLVMELCTSKALSLSIVKKIEELAVAVVENLVQLLTFLTRLPISIAHEKKLLFDYDPGRCWSLDDLLSNQLFSEDEKGLECRRTLSVLSCIGRSSCSSILPLSSSNILPLCLEIVNLISKLQRPLEFTGVYVAILHFIQTLLKKHENIFLPNKVIDISRKIVSEIIKSRPKLDVLTEVILTLGVAAHHKEFTNNICGKSRPDACALYMDAKLQQAMFFTSDACPLNILRIRTKTLGHFCNSKLSLQRLINSFSKWLHAVLQNVPPKPHWLYPQEETCCNILESFCHILSISISFAEEDLQFRCTFERGLITLKNCCKICRRRPRLYTINLLPHSLRQSKLLDLFTTAGKDAARYFISEFETAGVTQDSVT